MALTMTDAIASYETGEPVFTPWGVPVDVLSVGHGTHPDKVGVRFDNGVCGLMSVMGLSVDNPLPSRWRRA